MTDANFQEIEKIANAYTQATYEGDADALREIFHPSAVMNGYLGGQLMLGTPEPFFEMMANNPSLKSAGAPYKATIESMHRSGNIGSVTLSETGFGEMGFVNYLHLLCENGQWTITSKTFESN